MTVLLRGGNTRGGNSLSMRQGNVKTCSVQRTVNTWWIRHGNAKVVALEEQFEERTPREAHEVIEEYIEDNIGLSFEESFSGVPRGSIGPDEDSCESEDEHAIEHDDNESLYEPGNIRPKRRNRKRKQA